MSTQRQKSLIHDPKGMLQFNVGNQNIRMKKIRLNESNLPIYQKIYFSHVQKQSQSGMSYNKRLFFLKDQHSFGYISKFNQDQININNAKQTISLKNLRKVIPKGNIITLIFEIQHDKQKDKDSQKKWIFKMKDKKMTDAWTDIINYQVAQIPSRKTTLDKGHNQVENNVLLALNKQTLTQGNKYSSFQEQSKNKYKYHTQLDSPIANQRPQLNYFSREQTQNNSVSQKPKQPSKQSSKKNNNNNKYKQNQQILIIDKKSQKQIKQVKQKISKPVEQSRINQTIKGSLKKQQYNFSSSQYQSINQHSPKLKTNNKLNKYLKFNDLNNQDGQNRTINKFKIKNKQLKKKLLFPSYMNYLRPYLTINKQQKTFQDLKIINKKYSDFIKYCQLTSKQLLDINKNNYQLSHFKLINKFHKFINFSQNIKQQNFINKQKLKQLLIKQYQKIFCNKYSKQMSIQTLILLFQNIIYCQLEDIQIIIPLLELKLLPTLISNTNINIKQIKQSEINYNNLSSSSAHRICQNSLIKDFQNKFENLNYIYHKIQNDQYLSKYIFIPMNTIVQYKGFRLFFRTKVDQKIAKALSKIQSTPKSKKNLSQQQKKDLFTSNTKQQKISSNSLNLIQKLSQKIYIKQQIFQNQHIIKIEQLTIHNQINQNYEKTQKVKKYVITFADILPYKTPFQLFNFKIFQEVHSNNNLNFNIAKFSLSRRLSNKNDESQINIRESQKSISSIKTKNINKLQFYNPQLKASQNQSQIQCYKQCENYSIKLLADKLYKLQEPIIHSFQLNQLLKSHNLSHSSLTFIYNTIPSKNTFIRSLIKSQIAAQCFKMIVNKKIQQFYLDQSQRQQNLIKLKNDLLILFNFIFANQKKSQQSEMIWRVLTLHSQFLYNLPVSQFQVHKGFFILALKSKLNIAINPNTYNLQDIFQITTFLKDIEFISPKVYPPILSNEFLDQIQNKQINWVQKRSHQIFNKLSIILNLKNDNFPQFIKRRQLLYARILNLSVRSISPNNIHLSYDHLNIFQPKVINFTRKQNNFALISEQQKFTSKQKQQKIVNQNFILYYRMKKIQIQWLIRQNVSINNSIKIEESIQQIINQIKIFYSSHPFFSQLYQFLADYFCSKKQYNKALQIYKKGLTNMMIVCQGNISHVKLANCYYNLSIPYIGMRKIQDALAQLKKAKNCLEINNQLESSFYAIILIKMAKLNLFLNKNQQALINSINAKQILQKSENLKNEFTSLIECYQIIQQYLQTLKSQNQLKNKYKQIISLDPKERSQNYMNFLQNALKIQKQWIKLNKDNSKFNQICKFKDFQRIIRLIVTSYFRQMDNKALQLFSVYLCEIIDLINKKGISYVNDQYIQKQQNTQHQLQNDREQILLYPNWTSKKLFNNSNTQKLYSVYQAFLFIKKLIYSGQFILELIDYIQNCETILKQFKDLVRINNSPQASKIYYLKNSNKNSLNVSYQNNSNYQQNQNDRIIDSQIMNSLSFQRNKDFNNCLNISHNNIKFINLRVQKFDSFMKALTVLLGQGYFIHLFD